MWMKLWTPFGIDAEGRSLRGARTVTNTDKVRERWINLSFPLPLIVVAVWILAAGLPASPQDSHAALLQGTWRMNGYVNKKERRGQWYLEWTFADGKFKESGYPQLAQSGSYRVLRIEGDKLTLELYAQKGTFGNKNSRLDIVVDQQKDQLKIGSNGPFLRMKPKSRSRSYTHF